MGGPAQTSGFGGLGGSGYATDTLTHQALFCGQGNGAVADGFLRGIAGFYSAVMTAGAGATNQVPWPEAGGRLKRITLQASANLPANTTLTVYLGGVATALTGVIPAASTAIVEVDVDVNVPAGVTPAILTVRMQTATPPAAGQYIQVIVSGERNA